MGTSTVAGERRFHTGRAAAYDDQSQIHGCGGRCHLGFPAELRVNDTTDRPPALDLCQTPLEAGSAGDDVLLAPLLHLEWQIRIGDQRAAKGDDVGHAGFQNFTHALRFAKPSGGDDRNGHRAANAGRQAFVDAWREGHMLVVPGRAVTC